MALREKKTDTDFSGCIFLAREKKHVVFLNDFFSVPVFGKKSPQGTNMFFCFVDQWGKNRQI